MFFIMLQRLIIFAIVQAAQGKAAASAMSFKVAGGFAFITGLVKAIGLCDSPAD